MSEGEAAAGLTLSLNQNHRNFGAWQKSFQTDQGTDLDSWGLGVQGLKVICRLTCMRDSCSVDGTCQKPPPGHHCSEVQKGPPPTQNGRQRAQPPLTEGTRATKLHHQTTKLLWTPFPQTKSKSTARMLGGQQKDIYFRKALCWWFLSCADSRTMAL